MLLSRIYCHDTHKFYASAEILIYYLVFDNTARYTDYFYEYNFPLTNYKQQPNKSIYICVDRIIYK